MFIQVCWKHWKVFFVLPLLPICLYVFSALAEDASNAILPLEMSAEEEVVHLEAGLESEEVIERLGIPDRKEGPGKTGTESWHYGASVIFFAEGKVSAWSIIGNSLSLRQKMQVRRKKLLSVRRSFAEQGWRNAWQRYQQVVAEDVLQEIVPEPP